MSIGLYCEFSYLSFLLQHRITFEKNDSICNIHWKSQILGIYGVFKEDSPLPSLRRSFPSPIRYLPNILNRSYTFLIFVKIMIKLSKRGASGKIVTITVCSTNEMLAKIKVVKNIIIRHLEVLLFDFSCSCYQKTLHK